jgi:sialate O-acetylesterase
MKMKLILLAIICAGVAPIASAQVRVAGIFGPNMVLQREMPVPVWGWAKPGEKVTVEFKGQTKQAVTGEDGKWQVILDPMKADDKPATLTIRSADPQSKVASPTIDNVLVGEVWLCAGQSNMGMALKQCTEIAAEEIAAADLPTIRHYGNAHVFDGRGPRQDAQGGWTVTTPATAGDFAAVPHFFARSLQQRLNVPVGVLSLAYGGSRIEAWTSREALLTIPHGQETIIEWRATAYAQKLPHPANNIIANEDVPGGNPAVLDHPDYPAAIFNGKVAPVVPFAIRGCLWYQGENNSADGSQDQYASVMPVMIADWRRHWERDDLPFIMTQLPNIGRDVDGAWTILREAVLNTTRSTPNTAMAVTIDVGDPDDIHPRNKPPVGERLALAALHLAYGRDLVCSGPIFKAVDFADGKATLSFDHVGGGLVAKGGKLRAFAVAGEDRKFVPAEAGIDGRQVVVHSPRVAKPVAVRYAWSMNPPCNLYNKEGLPASPFRTDTWNQPPKGSHVGVCRKNNHSKIRIMPAAKPPTIDGKLDDWDLSGAIFMHMHAFDRDTYNCRAALMYDRENLYLACHIKDPTPMNNQYHIAEASYAWSADAVQFRFYSDPEKHSEIATWRDSPEKKDPAEQKKISHITAWYSTPDKKPGLQINHGLDYRDEQVNPESVQGAYERDADGQGYTMEYRIPVALLRAPRAYKPGDRIQAQFHVHWGRYDGRRLLSAMTDLTDPAGFNPTGAWDAGYHGPIGSGVGVFAE